MPQLNCFEMERTPNGWVGRMPGCAVEVRFSTHAAQRLQERYPGLSLEEALTRLPLAQVEAVNSRQRYLALSFSHWRVQERVALVLRYYGQPQQGAEVVTFYPPWDPNHDSRHLAVILQHGLTLTRRRNFLDFLERRCPGSVQRD